MEDDNVACSRRLLSPRPRREPLVIRGSCDVGRQPISDEDDQQTAVSLLRCRVSVVMTNQNTGPPPIYILYAFVLVLVLRHIRSLRRTPASLLCSELQLLLWPRPRSLLARRRRVRHRLLVRRHSCPIRPGAQSPLLHRAIRGDALRPRAIVDAPACPVLHSF